MLLLMLWRNMLPLRCLKRSAIPIVMVLFKTFRTCYFSTPQDQRWPKTCQNRTDEHLYGSKWWKPLSSASRSCDGMNMMTYIILRNIPSYTIICLWSAQSPQASCLSRSRNQGWLRCLSPSCIDEAHNLTCGERNLLILLLFLSHTGGSCIRFIRSYWYWDSWRTCLLLRANRWCLPEIHVHICIHGLPEIYVLTCIHGNRGMHVYT